MVLPAADNSCEADLPKCHLRAGDDGCTSSCRDTFSGNQVSHESELFMMFALHTVRLKKSPGVQTPCMPQVAFGFKLHIHTSMLKQLSEFDVRTTSKCSVLSDRPILEDLLARLHDGIDDEPVSVAIDAGPILGDILGKRNIVLFGRGGVGAPVFAPQHETVSVLGSRDPEMR